jgi:hypothetical protein
MVSGSIEYLAGGTTQRCTLPMKRGLFGMVEIEVLKSEAEPLRERR